MSMLKVALDPATVIVAVDPGKVMNRVWVSNGAGLLQDPLSLPVSRGGIGRLERLLGDHGVVAPVIAIEATGSLHRSGRTSWSGYTQAGCVCWLPRRLRLRAASWARAGSRPTTATARR